MAQLGLLRPAGGYLAFLRQNAISRPFYSLAADSTPKVACLKDVRGVLALRGTEVLHFMQGLVTNELTPLEAPDAKPVFACILTPLGRYAHDMIFYRSQGPEPSLLVDIDRKGKEDVIRLLRRYRMHQKIDIEDVSDQYTVWVQFGADALPTPAGSWHQDPRLPELGLRTILPNSGGGEAGSGAKEVPWREYRRWRIQQGVAEGDSEIPSGDAIPLEYNIEALSGVSFNKGCYVGQEFMARVHFKGVVRKRLMPFRVEQPMPGGCATGPCCLDAGSQVCDVYDAAGALESVGSVRVCEGDVGLAMVKVKAGLMAQQTGEPLYVRRNSGGEYMLIRPWRPGWWPAEWGCEE